MFVKTWDRRLLDLPLGDRLTALAEAFDPGMVPPADYASLSPEARLQLAATLRESVRALVREAEYTVEEPEPEPERPRKVLHRGDR